MANPPLLSGREIIKILASMGYHSIRQKGSHIRLACVGRKSISVPDHKEIGRGLLRKILRDAELLPDDFLKLMR